MSALTLWRSFIWRLVKRRKLCVCSKKVSQSATSCFRACSEASKWTSVSILCAKIRVSRNWSSVSTREFQNEPGKLLLRAETAQRFYYIRFGKIDMSLVLPDDKCMKTILSAKRQVSIPKRLCDELELEPGA